VVLNGIELGGGSVRIHRKEDVQSKVFRALKIDAEEAQALGFLPRRPAVVRAAARRHRDRPRPLRDVLVKAESLRDVIVFPEDAAGAGPAHQRAGAGGREAAAELHYPVAEHPEPGSL
jgi:aspartyl-tRNA synthetase